MGDGTSSVLKGIIGERIATHYLCKNGYQIVKNNFRCRYGEVDIIAIQSLSICFIEVKAWSTFGYEDIAYAINMKKRKRIIDSAQYFLRTHSGFSDYAPTFAVLFIDMRTNDCRYVNAAFEQEDQWHALRG